MIYSTDLLRLLKETVIVTCNHLHPVTKHLKRIYRYSAEPFFLSLTAGPKTAHSFPYISPLLPIHQSTLSHTSVHSFPYISPLLPIHQSTSPHTSVHFSPYSVCKAGVLPNSTAILSEYDTIIHILSRISYSRGRDSSVSIATRYGLDYPGIDSWWRRDFPHPSRPALGPSQPPILRVPGLSRG